MNSAPKQPATAEKSAEDLAARLMAVDLELLREFEQVSYPNVDVLAEKLRAKYIGIVRAWMKGK
jgi:hypothetical protein